MREAALCFLVQGNPPNRVLPGLEKVDFGTGKYNGFGGKNDIPFEHMWRDNLYWLPRILAGERIRASFTFGEDNETVAALEIEVWDGA